MSFTGYSRGQVKINLIWLTYNQQPPAWEHGKIIVCPPEPKVISNKIQEFSGPNNIDACLFWDDQFPLPSKQVLAELLRQQNDVFHAGLFLGNAGQPEFINYVSPTWMLNRDPDPTIDATSWRLSLRACLIRTDVLRQIGGPLPGFETLEAASLEMGYRFIRNGVFIRHCPKLLVPPPESTSVKLPATDHFKFISTSFGKKWLYWAAFRILANKSILIRNLLPALKSASRFTGKSQVTPYFHQDFETKTPSPTPSVSVLIPSVNRYPYLRTLLTQLRTQTIKPLEIIVIDQTTQNARDKQLKSEFVDLPIRWFEMDEAGQCSSRNLGLVQSNGNSILLLDDDVEIYDNLIENHIINLHQSQAKISSGIVVELGKDKQIKNSNAIRISDVFPGGNSLIFKEVLQKTGLFDLAFDHGQRADHDLGMRIYLSGVKMVINPEISILHHHAPQGGLREHKARVITRSASRKSLTLRVLPSPSDIYLAKRYFTEHQVSEMLWISIFETFSYDGPAWKKALKGLISLFALPQTLIKLRGNVNKANSLLLEYPQIPGLDE